MAHWKDILKFLSSVLHSVFRWFFFSHSVFVLCWLQFIRRATWISIWSLAYKLPLEFGSEKVVGGRVGVGRVVGEGSARPGATLHLGQSSADFVPFLRISGKPVQMALHFVRFAICICTHPECNLYRLQLSCVGLPTFAGCATCTTCQVCKEASDRLESTKSTTR